MNKQKSLSTLHFFILAMIGALSGLVLNNLNLLPFNDYFKSTLAYGVVLLAGLISFAVPLAATKQFFLALSGTILLIVFAATGGYLSHNTNAWYGLSNFYTYLLLYFSIYSAFCFHQTYLESGSGSYLENLVITAWNKAFIIITGIIFAVIVEIILLAIAFLFKQLQLTTLYDFITNSNIVYFTSGLFLGLGIAVCRQQQELILAWLKLFFSLSYFFLPLFALVNLILLAALFYQQPLAAAHNETLIALIVIAILLINAVHSLQLNGRPPYNRWIRYLVNLFIIMLPAFPALILFDQIQLMNHYGIRPVPLQLALFTSILGLYTVSYLLALLISFQKWLKWLPHFNAVLAVLTIMISIAINNPLLNPVKLSVANQIHRLQAGKAVSGKQYDQGAFLFKANLSGKDLSHKNLAYANLNKADLSHSDLQGANLISAQLVDTNLSHAKLKGANLTGAYLSGTIFNHADLSQVTLSDYNRFHQVKGLTQQQLNQTCATKSYHTSQGLTVPLCLPEEK